MSGQLIELIIFGLIAFFVINKLISILGSTSEDDPTRSKTFFGEGGGIKDVTPALAKKSQVIKASFAKKKKLDLKGIIVKENEADIRSGLKDVLEKVPAFNITTFLKSSKVAFKMIIKAGAEEDSSDLEDLVDKRYLEHYKSMASSYGNYSEKSDALNAHVSEIYMFGNNIFIKILFAGQNITDKVKELHEEWTFTKSALSSGPEWHLTNIDRPQ